MFTWVFVLTGRPRWSGSWWSPAVTGGAGTTSRLWRPIKRSTRGSPTTSSVSWGRSVRNQCNVKGLNIYNCQKFILIILLRNRTPSWMATSHLFQCTSNSLPGALVNVGSLYWICTFFLCTGKNVTWPTCLLYLVLWSGEIIRCFYVQVYGIWWGSVQTLVYLKPRSMPPN